MWSLVSTFPPIKFTKLMSNVVNPSRLWMLCDSGVAQCAVLQPDEHGMPSEACNTVRDDLARLMESVSDHANVIQGLRFLSEPLYDKVLHSLRDIRTKLGHVDGSSAVITTSQAQMRGPGHPPPLAVAHYLRMPSCKETCPQCQGGDCHACPQCCLKKREVVQGMSLVLGWQKKVRRANRRAWFCVGGSAFPMNESFAAVFDTAGFPCGLWTDPDSEQFCVVEVVMGSSTTRVLPVLRVHDEDEGGCKRRRIIYDTPVLTADGVFKPDWRGRCGCSGIGAKMILLPSR